MSRPVLDSVRDSLDPPRQPAQDRQQRDQLVASGLPQCLGSEPFGVVAGSECSRLGHEVEAGREPVQCALQGAERPEDGRELGWNGQPVLGDDAEQIGEHAHAGCLAGIGVPSQEPAQVAFEALFVDGVRPRHQLQKGVADPERVTAIDRKQQPLQRVAQSGIEPADGAEVEQAEPSAVEEEDVASMRGGVKDAVEEDLP